MRKIKITVGSIEISAELRNTKTADAIWNALPIEAKANIWGDEIYFSIPVHVGEENSQEIVEIGDIAYWPPGNAFCIFFGRTPASLGNEIRPASPVNVVGKIDGDPKVFKSVASGEKVILEKILE